MTLHRTTCSFWWKQEFSESANIGRCEAFRLIRDGSVGIPWIGYGAAGKAAFMLVREVSVRVDMVMPGPEGSISITIHRELSRDLNKRYS